MMKGGKMGRLNKAKWCLLGCLIVVLVLVASSVFVPNSLTNVVNWVASNDFAGKLRGLSEREAAEEGTLIEMVVDRIGISEIGYQPVVILKEKGGDLYLPIWIGPLEASAISLVLERVEVPRPLTADLLCSMLDRMGESVDYIVVNDLQNQTFYANIMVRAGWTQMDIDARPSDAIALALRAGAPVLVAEEVLEQAALVSDDDEADEPEVSGEEQERFRKLVSRIRPTDPEA